MSARPSRRTILKSGASIAVGAPALLSSAAFAQDPTAVTHPPVPERNRWAAAPPSLKPA